MFRVAKLDIAPLTYVDFSVANNDREMTEHLNRVRALLVEDQRLERKSLIVLDLRRSRVLTTSQRRITAVWMKDITPLYKRTTLGTAFIVESTLVRGVLHALLWMQPEGTPYAVVRDLDAAVAWAVKRFDEMQVPLPESVRGNLSAILAEQLGQQAPEVAASGM